MADTDEPDVSLIFYENMLKCPAQPFFLRHLADLIESGHSPNNLPYSSETACIAAVLGQKVVGCLAFNIIRPSRTGWVVIAAVDPIFRRRGYYRMMHAEAERHMQRMGANSISSNMHVNNSVALAAALDSGRKIEFYRVSKKLQKVAR
jgi:ribosomal protein S18 acetylase RimI-like enzyme